MYLRLSQGTIDQTHGRNALPLSPTSTSIVLEQARQLANAIRGRDRLRIPQRTYDLEPWCAQIRLPSEGDVGRSSNLQAGWPEGSGCSARLGSSHGAAHYPTEARRAAAHPFSIRALESSPYSRPFPFPQAQRAHIGN